MRGLRSPYIYKTPTRHYNKVQPFTDFTYTRVYGVVLTPVHSGIIVCTLCTTLVCTADCTLLFFSATLISLRAKPDHIPTYFVSVATQWNIFHGNLGVGRVTAVFQIKIRNGRFRVGSTQRIWGCTDNVKQRVHARHDTHEHTKDALPFLSLTSHVTLE